jgi:hypothetical protein
MVWKRIIRGPQGKRGSVTGSVWKGNETSPIRNIGTSAGREWENTRDSATIDDGSVTTTTTAG